MLSDLVYVIPILIFYFPIIASLQKYKWLLKCAYCANKTHFWFLFLMYTIMLMLGLKKKTLGQMTEVPALPASPVAPPNTSNPAPTLKGSLPGAGLPLPPAPPPPASLCCVAQPFWLCISSVFWLAPGHLSFGSSLGSGPDVSPFWLQ